VTTLAEEDEHVIYAAHREMAETEGESVTYTVAGVLELDTSPHTIRYDAGWAEGDAALVKWTATRVLGAMHTLVEALTEPASAEEGAGGTTSSVTAGTVDGAWRVVRWSRSSSRLETAGCGTSRSPHPQCPAYGPDLPQHHPHPCARTASRQQPRTFS